LSGGEEGPRWNFASCFLLINPLSKVPLWTPRQQEEAQPSRGANDAIANEEMIVIGFFLFL
jgi:hypothetical protein